MGLVCWWLVLWLVLPVALAAQPPAEAQAQAEAASGFVPGVYRVTAYCDRGRTAAGTLAGPGTVAAPHGVPFGTRLWVEGYGLAVVLDRGGAITAGRLDVWLPCAEAWQWGVRWARAHELEEGA